MRLLGLFNITGSCLTTRPHSGESTRKTADNLCVALEGGTRPMAPRVPRTQRRSAVTVTREKTRWEVATYPSSADPSEDQGGPLADAS